MSKQSMPLCGNNQGLLKENKLSFMDFCAGIGGGRFGLCNSGFNCVGFSEIDKYSEETYRHFFGAKELNYGDLMKIDSSKLPSFDLMIAGFPCQPFSVIGKKKGINDERGQVIYGLIKILKDKKVPYFILENVKGLINQDNGKSLKIILKELESVGYVVNYKVLNSLDYGVPQSRKRIYFVGIRKDLVKNEKEFEWPKPVKTPKIQEFLIDDTQIDLNERRSTYDRFLKYLDSEQNRNKFKIEDLLKEEYLVVDTRQSDLRLYRNRIPTLRTGNHNIFYVKNGKFKKISGFEGLLLQGFSVEVARKVSGMVADKYLLNQVGNSMTVTVIGAIGKSLLKYINGE